MYSVCPHPSHIKLPSTPPISQIHGSATASYIKLSAMQGNIVFCVMTCPTWKCYEICTNTCTVQWIQESCHECT